MQRDSGPWMRLIFLMRGATLLGHPSISACHAGDVVNTMAGLMTRRLVDRAARTHPRQLFLKTPAAANIPTNRCARRQAALRQP